MRQQPLFNEDNSILGGIEGDGSVRAALSANRDVHGDQFT